MGLKIKNWERFQHFKDRKPPWIKLYRDLLDDKMWFELDAEAAKLLVMLWLIASEHDGELPPIPELAFRLRISERSIKSNVSKLGHWLRQDDIKPISDINAISDGYQADVQPDNGVIPLARSRERETERETEERALGLFEKFWEVWPKSERKGAKGECLAKWEKLKLNGQAEAVIAHVEMMKVSRAWTDKGGQFIPAPLVYLNGKSWDGAEKPERIEAPQHDPRRLVI